MGYSISNHSDYVVVAQSFYYFCNLREGCKPSANNCLTRF